MAAKGREKSRPKMGKIHLAYNKLHDAFFRWQTKPELTIYGDLYYENREKETKLKDLKPGNMSEELRAALGMATRAEEATGVTPRPPPWLINMQRYGPPPSYPMLKVHPAAHLTDLQSNVILRFVLDPKIIYSVCGWGGQIAYIIALPT